MEIDKMALGIRIRNRRLRKHLTQAELSELSGLSVTYISLIERGRRQPSLPCIIRLANSLTVSAEYLLYGSDTQGPNQSSHLIAELLASCPKKKRQFVLELLVEAVQLLQHYFPD